MPPRGAKHTLQARLKLSRSHQARWAERNLPNEKECHKCGKVSDYQDFPRRKSTRADGSILVSRCSPCKVCQKENWEAFWARKEAEGTAEELNREYRSRRKPKPRVLRRKKPPSPPKLPYRMPVEPIAKVLDRELERHSLAEIAAATRVPVGTLSVYKRRRRQFLNFHNVDKILTGLGKPEELHFLYPGETG